MFFEGCSVCAALCPTMGQELPARSLKGKMCFIQIGIISSPNPPVPSGLASVNDQLLRPNCYSCSSRVMGGARRAGEGPFVQSPLTARLGLWMERYRGSCALCASTRKLPPKHWSDGPP